MRKILVLGLAVLVLLIGVFPAVAAPLDELSALAQYFPANTPLFAAQRVDDAYIDQMNDLLNRLDTQVGGELLDGMTLHDALDMMAKEIEAEGDFESVLGNWLGDTAAIGVLDVKAAMEDKADTDVPVLLALAVTDSRAAELFVDNNKPVDYVKEQLNDGILYRPSEPDRNNPTILLLEGALLIRPSSLDSMAIVPGFDKSLADNPEFGAALGRLPRDDYDSVAYVDLAGLRFFAEQAQQELNDENVPMHHDLPALFEAAGAQAMGGVIEDGHVFILDLATNLKDLAVLEEAGLSMTAHDPIDLSFTTNIPAGTIAFMQSTNIGEKILQGFDKIEKMGDAISEEATGSMLDHDMEGMQYIDEAMTFMRLSFEGLSGLTLEDALGWMSGDAAMMIRAVEGNEMIPLFPDMVSMVAVTDESAAESLANAVPQMLFELGIDTTEEDGVLVMPLFGEMAGDNKLDMLFANTGELMLSGTRPGVEAILAAESNITAEPVYQAASKYFLADAHMLGYVDGTELHALVQMGAEITGDRDLREVSTVTALLESLSMTAIYDENGSGNVRFVLSIVGAE